MDVQPTPTPYHKEPHKDNNISLRRKKCSSRKNNVGKMQKSSRTKNACEIRSKLRMIKHLPIDQEQHLPIFDLSNGYDEKCFGTNLDEFLFIISSKYVRGPDVMRSIKKEEIHVDEPIYKYTSSEMTNELIYQFELELME